VVHVNRSHELRNAESQNTNRLAVVDNFKGILVLLMIVYHAASASIRELGTVGQLVIGNLLFLHSGFLFATGFLVSTHYRLRAQVFPSRTSTRILRRSGKLAVLFIVSNLLVATLSDQAYLRIYNTLTEPSRVANEVILSISGTVFAFEILGYFVVYLLIASLTCRCSDLTLWIIGISLLVISSAYCKSSTAQFIFVAIAGELTGRWYISFSCYEQPEPNKPVDFRLLAIWLFIRPVSYFGYMMKSTILLADTLTWWFAISAISSKLSHVLSKNLKLISQNTLLAYFVQMPLIRIFYWLVGVELGIISYIVVACLSGLCMYTVVYFVQYWSDRCPLVRRGYNLVFG
jgi:hypothetical protein